MAPVAPKPDYSTQEIISVFTQRCAWSIRRNTAEIQSKIKELSDDIKPNLLAPVADSLSQSPDAVRQRKKKFKVGIIGAGCAGLFTAMLFDHLKENFGLDVEYEILEANDSDRVGGRLFTYEFPPRPLEEQKSKGKIEREAKKRGHDYYDVGAMRFPENHVMKRTFALFKLLGMEKFNPSEEEKRQNPDLKPDPGNLIRYWMDGVNISIFLIKSKN